MAPSGLPLKIYVYIKTLKRTQVKSGGSGGGIVEPTRTGQKCFTLTPYVKLSAKKIFLQKGAQTVTPEVTKPGREDFET